MIEKSKQNEEIEALKKELSMLKEMNETAMLGWWHINFTTRTYTGSELLQKTIGVPNNKLTFDEFNERIHPDHRDRIIRNAMMFNDVGFYEDEFPLMTKNGYRWLHAKLGDKQVTENGVEAFGYVRFLDNKEVKIILGHNAETQIKNVIDNYISISSSLLNLQNSSDPQIVIQKTLQNLLEQFDADRVYIFEYDKKKSVQRCIYEAVASGINQEQDNLQDVFIDEVKWWSDRLLNNIPIVINNVADMPEEALSTKEILQIQGIKSIMAMPLMSHDSVWGYIGIDFVKDVRFWSNLDKQWLFALGNIIGLCMELKKSEQIATNEQIHFRNLYENMPIGFLHIKLILDQDGKPIDYTYIEVNKAFETITQIKRDQIIGKNALQFSILTPERLEILGNVLKNNLIQNGFKFIRSNEDRYCQYSAYTLGNNEIIIIFHDTTDIIIANKALSKSEAKLREIYNSLPTGVEIYDKAGMMTDINEKDLQIFGVASKSSLIGKINLFDNPNVPQVLLEKLKYGKDIEVDFKYDFSNIADTNYYYTTLKNVKNLSVKGTVIFDSNNEIGSYILTIIDNTDTIKAFDKIQEFEILFDSIAEFSEIGLSHWDPINKKFSATNQWYNNLEIKKTNIGNILDAYVNLMPEDYTMMKQNFDDLISGKISFFRSEVCLKSLYGKKWLRCSYKTSKYDPDNNTIEIIGYNIDITELKETEFKLRDAKTKAEESDKLKSAFVANMSHEIRTPLNAIVGFSDLLTQTVGVAEREQYSSIIRKNNDLLLQLISDILDISRIESGITNINFEKINVKNMLEEVLCTNTIKVSDNIELIFDNKHDNCTINSDRNRLIQIFNNLITNAIKFTSKGSIHLGYKLEQDKIVFYVKDTGIGIAEENIENIFERFVKLNTFFQGTGLGLPICKSLIERLNGRIRVESTLNEGSCFFIELPYNSAEEIKIDPYNAPQKEEIKLKKDVDKQIKPLVLVAEDTDSNYLLINAILKNEYRLARANNGIEAIKLFNELNPDIVLMDMQMPLMNGQEATMKIRERDKTTPIIAVTAFAFDQDKIKAFNAGCNEYISKPISQRILKELLSKHTH